MVLLWGSAVLSAIVDNIPYVATMSPVVADMVEASADPDRASVLWWARALGVDLCGNATAVGASANVVVLGIAELACRTCGCTTSRCLNYHSNYCTTVQSAFLSGVLERRRW